jgi:uncharacterized LabA/DUF88 family protein
MTDRTALLIDGANLFASTKSLGYHMDWKKLKEFFIDHGCPIVRANYYTAIRDTRNTEEQDSIIPLIDYLAFNGWKVVTKPVMEYMSRDGISTLKGNVDVQIAVDAIVLSDRIDHLILGSGDGDFVYLVDALHRKGLEVTIVSTIVTQPPMCSTALRREADHFYDLSDLKKYCERSEKRR